MSPLMVRIGRARLQVAALLLLLVELVICFVHSGPSIPDNVMASAAGGTEFSAVNALTLHRELISSEPHPSGTEENQATRDRIAERLRAQGWTVELQFAPAAPQRYRPEPMSLTNIVAYRPEQVGLTGTPLVLSSHYDSCRFGPGAGDAGGCVAAILEASQCLINRKLNWNRPLWVLLTDAEEDGLVGARYFVEHHPVMKRKPVFINLDARGNAGPAVMYETHVGNLQVIQKWGSSIASPVVTGSPFTAIYRTMPNGTDFTEFINAGCVGFNFALVNGADHYHQPTDTVDRLSASSVQHFGNQIMSLATLIGTSPDVPTTIERPALGAGAGPDSGTESQDDAVFFDVLGLFLIQWPSRIAVPLAAVVVLLLVILKRKVLMYRDGMVSFLLVALAGIVILVISAATGWGMTRIFRETGLLPRAFVAWGHWLSAGLCLLVVTLSVLVAAGFLYRRSAEHVWDAHGLWAGVLCLLAAVLAPAFSHLFLIPAIASLVFSVIRLNAVVRAFCFVGVFGVMLVPIQHLISIALGPAAGLVLALVYSTNGLALLPLIPRELAGRQGSSNLQGREPV